MYGSKGGKTKCGNVDWGTLISESTVNENVGRWCRTEKMESGQKRNVTLTLRLLYVHDTFERCFRGEMLHGS